ncbi:hypothetical protein [Corynebacterium caspium]|uniref:hypothetical protein n=1 Tax=Corynebacterium caspium TaxID=234828 RepID=UPI0003618786|nr:hypothetical protein [Corynebacterium caspium]WKD58663.1 hypothetical protein CCASP_01185 [Corynebacterium caspium DSM 44850]
MQGWSDSWLDEVSGSTRARRGAWITATFGTPAIISRRLWHFLRTTPGLMGTLSTILVIAIFSAGYALSSSTQIRSQELDYLLRYDEPTAYAAHNLSTSLSLMDTVATGELVSTGAPNPTAFHEALDRAAIAAAAVAAGVTDPRSTELIMEIQRELPVYAGIVETARANNRQGHPVAVSYMTEASALLRDDILPAANELFELSSTHVYRTQQELLSPQWLPMSGLILTFLLLIGTQFWLWRATRRRLNRGFLTATFLLLIILVWGGSSNISMWRTGIRSAEVATTPWASLTNARIEAQQARTTETLAIVRRSSLADTSTNFRDTIAHINSALDSYQNSRPEDGLKSSVVAARIATNNWTTEHNKLVGALTNGEFTTASRLATDSSAQQLDSILADLIADSRTTMRGFISSGLAATNNVSISVLLLSLGAVMGVLLGIRPRIREYL